MGDEMFRQDPNQEDEPTFVQPESFSGEAAKSAFTPEPAFSSESAKPAFTPESAYSGEASKPEATFSGGQAEPEFTPNIDQQDDIRNNMQEGLQESSGYQRVSEPSAGIGVEYEKELDATTQFAWKPGDTAANIISEKEIREELPENPGRKKRPKMKSTDSDDSGKRRSGFGRLLVLAVVFGLVAGAAFQGVNLGIKKLTKKDDKQVELAESKKKSEAVESVEGMEGNAAGLPDVSAIVEMVEPSIVSVTVIIEQEVQYYFQTYTQEAQGAGSGIIIGKDEQKLYVITNYHVIQGADKINIGFCNDTMAEAYVTGFDADQDIAVVEVPFSNLEGDTASAIKVATLGDSDELKVGQAAIAIGNALGFGQSVTVGYISALNRGVEGFDGNYIQTDAAINPGNSGGALIDSQGRLIGINSAKYVDSKVEGMGFSIPINTAMDIVNDIIDGTQEKKAVFGASGFDIGWEYSEIYNLPEGIFINKVNKDSPADKSGIREKDIIVEIDGKSVYTMEELKTIIEEKKVGDSLSVTYYRADQNGNYQKNTVKVTLAGQ